MDLNNFKRTELLEWRGTSCALLRLQIVASLMISFICSASLAQTGPEEATPYEGKIIENLVLAADGPLLRISEADLSKLITLKEGSAFSYSSARHTISQLYSTELFHDVQIDVENERQDSVDLRLILVRKYVIQKVSFDGDVELNERVIRRELALREGEPFLEDNQTRTLSRLRDLYDREGYYLAQIEPEYELDPELARLEITYQIEAGEPATLTSLDFELEGDITEEEIREVIELQEDQDFSESRLDETLSSIRSLLSLDGFFRAEAYLPQGVNYDRSQNAAEVTIRVVAHEQTQVRFEGIELDREEKLALPLYQERNTGRLLLEQSVQQLERTLQEKGFFLAEVAVDTIREEGGIPSAVTFSVDRRRKYDLKNIRFEGKHSGDPDQLKRLLISEEAGLFSRGQLTDDSIESDKERLKFFFERRGYRDVEVSHEFQTEDENLNLIYRIEEGPRYFVNSLVITGNEGISADRLRDELELTEGQPFSTYAVTSDRANLIAVYQNNGYQNVQFQSTIEYGTDQAVSLTYIIEEGLQYSVDNVLVVGALETRRGTIDDQILVEPNQPFSFERNLQSETNLYDLAIFNRVRVRSIPSYEGEQQRSVLFRVDEAKKYTIIYGVGYSHTFGGVSSEGARGTFGITNSNFLGRAQSLSTSVRAGRRRQRGNISYSLRRPLGYSLPTVISVTADNEERVNETNGELISVRGRPFDSFRFGISGQSERILSRRESMFLRYNFERILLNIPEDLEAPIEFFRAQKDLRLSSFSLSYLNESRNQPNNPTEGFFVNGEIKVPAKIIGSEAQFFRFISQGQYYHPLFPDLTLAAVLRLGFIEPFGEQFQGVSNPVPISERFFAGGAATIRSIPLDLAGPLLRDDETNELILVKPSPNRDPVPVPLGGNVLIVGNLELRFPLFSRFGGALFVDSGNVFKDFSSIPNSRFYNAVGFGLTIESPIGPIRIDAAYNPDPRDIPAFKQWLFHFNLGQPF